MFTVARNLAIDSYRAGASHQATEAALRQAAATREATVAGPTWRPSTASGWPSSTPRSAGCPRSSG